MCNRKTKQWHIKPKLAEYKRMTVYCIVNKLKTVPSEKQDNGEVTMKMQTALPADLYCEAAKVWERERVDELEVHCHLRFATSGTEQLMIISSSV